jgi:hypothetical protein
MRLALRWIPFVVALGAGTASAAAAQPDNRYTRLVRDQLTRAAAVFVDRGFRVADQPVLDRLGPEETATHEVTLTGGREYVLVGVCDEDCQDVDLRLLDADGDVLAEDVAADDTPILMVRAP